MVVLSLSLMTSVMSPARKRLQSALLYLVTPAVPKAGSLGEFLPRVLEGGVDMIQLREKDMDAKPLLEYAEVARKRTREFGALLIINDRVDVALAAGADGVHLGQDDLPLDPARDQVGPNVLIGLSTHSDDQIEDAIGSEADYIGVGPVHHTPTHPERLAVGEDLVTYAADRFSRPFYAIGGINLENLTKAIEAGATRVSVVRALTEAEDPLRIAREMKLLLNAAVQ